MRYSKLFGKTLRDKPRNADSLSHQLLLRAGFVKAEAGGGFILLPLGQRVLEKVRRIAGAATVGLPGASTPSDVMRSLRLQRSDAGLAYPFADQHEAALAMIAGNLSMSYRDLPLALSTEHWGSRTEAHPNWGLLSGPEFLVHATYAFGATPVNYGSTIARAGVVASPLDNELILETELAARPLLVCADCGYRQAAERAVSRTPRWPQDEEPHPRQSVYGPGLIGVDALARFVGIPVHQTTKTLLFETGGRVIAACVAGPYGVSEAKLRAILGCGSLALAAPETVRALTNAEVGYAGPIGLPDSVQVIWDFTTEHRSNFEAGANQTDHHLIHLHFGRDLPRPPQFLDIRMAQPGDPCSQCAEGTLAARGGITLAHTMDLGEAYSQVLGAKYLDAEKTTRPLPIACAALDLTALMAAIVEQNHDDRGILWPQSVAPFDAHLISLPPAEAAAEALYIALTQAGVDVLWDDRGDSAGVKFGDADLIGIPVRLVLSKRTGDKVEWKARNAAQGELLTVAEVMDRL